MRIYKGNTDFPNFFKCSISHSIICDGKTIFTAHSLYPFIRTVDLFFLFRPEGTLESYQVRKYILVN